eukprot:906496-Rhodomonas_salina.8
MSDADAASVLQAMTKSCSGASTRSMPRWPQVDLELVVSVRLVGMVGPVLLLANCRRRCHAMSGPDPACCASRGQRLGWVCTAHGGP